MINELLQNTVSVTSIRLRDAGGAAVTGVVKADVGIYSVKAGAGSAAVALDASYFDWAEVSSANYPGLYRLSINATGVANNVLDTLGAFSIRLTDILAGGFIPFEDEFEVTPKYHWDSLQRILGLSKENSKLEVLTTNAHGFMETGTLTIYDDNTLTTPVTAYDIVVTYDISGVLSDQTISEQ